MMRNLLLATLLSLFCFSLTEAQDTEGLVVELQPFASGFDKPVDITHAGDARLFVVEKDGVIRIMNGEGERGEEPFLDIRDRVTGGGERGLLGLAFHPDYASNGYFYVHYTGAGGDSHISRFEADPSDPDAALAESEFLILEVAQPRSNHNAGALAFGPDGYLYIALGDGGGGGDPDENGQNRLTLLGSMLRIDVDTEGDEPYAIPESNPFAEDDFTLDEIWALGLRNPWRFSFDRETGDMWIGDVGQNEFEEIDFQPASSVGGENYGWDCYEGFEPFEPENCTGSEAFTEPVYVYSHSEGGCSVTGGRVYRGEEFPRLEGIYFFTDYCDGLIRALVPDGEGGFGEVDLVDGNNGDLVSFGEDVDGELFLAGLSSGNIYRLVDACAPLVTPEIEREEGVLSVPDTFDTYQWYVDGEAVEGATGASLEAPDEGSAFVSLGTSAGCVLQTETFVITGLEERLGITRWDLGPNPFSENFRVDIQMREPVSLTLRVHDMSGSMVWEKKLPAAGRISEIVDLPDRTSGIYLISLDDGRQSVTRRLVRSGQ